MSPARPTEVSPRRAAALLGAHVKTVRKWCDAAVRGEPSPIGPVRVTGTGRYFIDRDSVDVGKVRARRNKGV